MADTRDFQIGDYVHVVDTAATSTYVGGYITAQTSTTITVTVAEVWGTLGSAATTWQIDRASVPPTTVSTVSGGLTTTNFLTTTASGYFSLSGTVTTLTGTTSSTNGQLQLHQAGNLSVAFTLSGPSSAGRSYTIGVAVGGVTGGTTVSATDNKAVTASYSNIAAGSLVNLSEAGVGNPTARNGTWVVTFTPAAITQPGQGTNWLG